MAQICAAGKTAQWSFNLLGPLEVSRDDRVVPLGPAKQRALLTGMLLDAGRTLSTGRLVELLWDDRPPMSALANVRTYTARLRAALPDPRGPGGSRMVRRPPGYLVEADPGELDFCVFADLAARGRAALGDGRWDEAAAGLGQAMTLWRGTEAAEDVVRGAALSARLVVLDELRLATREDHTEARLAQGMHSALVPELRAAVEDDPLRERLQGQLMRALYRSGDVRGALDSFALARRALVDQLGIDPGRELDQLHRAILDRDDSLLARRPPGAVPAVVARSPATCPRELPADVAAFVGRGAELTRIAATFAEDTGQVVLIHGPGGGGKSALAVRAGHRLTDRFDDGQLYVDLSANPGVAAVLGHFLRALGLPSREVPDDVDEAAARFRSLLAGRKVLVLLDNARDEAQIRPLLPSTRGSAVLVTSRNPLASVDCAARITTGPLVPADAVRLLGLLAGDRHGESASAAGLAALCDHLPLALRIAGARLAARPDRSIAALAADLEDETWRLDGLVAGDLSMRDCLAASYRDLLSSPHAELDTRLFRLIGVARLDSVSVAIAAALAGVSTLAATASLDRLIQAQLLVPGERGRCAMPSLVRLYAAELGEQAESRSAREAAVHRVLSYLLGTHGRIIDLVAGTSQDLSRVVSRLSVLFDDDPAVA